ncbi:MAG TPA: energy transducer TonB [Steroidobacteraceae bacterium]|nr:energy transducer TonB [Steroidobacteraceae bacterium]
MPRIQASKLTVASLDEVHVAARSVRVALFVQPDGRITDLVVERSSGSTQFDEAAIRYVQSARFLPGTRNGIPEAMWLSLEVGLPR